MRGKTYKFVPNGISSSHPFKIFHNGTFTNTIINSSGEINLTILQNHSTILGDLYYICENHISMKSNMNLLYREINETDESTASYDFYYGSININVSNNFNSASVYCYYHGYMGGKNLLQYSTDCSSL